jgi:signal transduction histidine kinase
MIHHYYTPFAAQGISSVLPVKDLLASSSLRMGAYAFAVLAMALCSLTFFWHGQTRRIAEQDMIEVMNSYREQIGDGLERYGPSYAQEYIERALGDADPYVLLGYQRGESITGNVQPTYFTTAPERRKFWETRDVLLPSGGEAIPVRLALYRYNNDAVALVGYDMRRFEEMREMLWRTLIVNIAVAVFLAGILSALLVVFVSRKLRPINRACRHVMQGELTHRLPEGGGMDQFDQLASNFNAMLGWIDTLLKTSAETSNSIAHDLRAPLSRLRLALADLSRDKDTPQPIAARLRLAQDDIDRLVRMFGDVLTIARVDAGSSRSHFTPVSITALLTDLAELYTPLAEEKGLLFKLTVPENPVIMGGDRGLLAQAFSNLLDNAIKYTATGSVHVILQEEHHTINITIADTGIGIEAADRERVFDRFVRLEEARSTPGFGLGLSLAAAVIRLHHGNMRLEDNTPGLRVHLNFPVEA